MPSTTVKAGAFAWQAQCECGWRGNATAEPWAHDEADAHRIVHLVDHAVSVAGDEGLLGPGSETLDEYRRRVM